MFEGWRPMLQFLSSVNSTRFPSGPSSKSRGAEAGASSPPPQLGQTASGGISEKAARQLGQATVTKAEA
jgi:hypothetical protein